LLETNWKWLVIVSATSQGSTKWVPSTTS
jgi:hypothetical protein